MFQPYLAEYRYYALFESQGMSDISRAKGLHRSAGGSDEQRYEGHGRWKRSDGLSRAQDRDCYDDYREATPAEVEHLVLRTDAQQPEEPLPSSRDGFEGGGFAVFRHQADMIDLRSACAVVDELSPEHRFALPLAPFERGELAGVVALLAARRRAEPVDGHYYFAEFDRLDEVVDLDRAHALLRCPASGEGQWETYLQDGAWVLGKEPGDHVVLPVCREEAERIIRGRETAEARYFDVWHGLATEGGFYIRELVRRTGPGDETLDDLGFQPTDVLGRLEPGWWVEEFHERHFSMHRYVDTLMARSRRFRDQPHDYHAVFRGEHDVYDFGKVLFVVRRFVNHYEGSAYERWTSDGWQPVENVLWARTLRISEEEFQQLTEPRPDERGSGDLRR